MRLPFIFILLLVYLGANAHIRLPKLISDGMILQRNTQINIWGWADPGEKVTVEFLKNSYTGVTNDNGKWSITIAAKKEGGPFDLIVRGSNEITIKNVAYGDVWLCSGQSNMELEIERVKYRYKLELENVNAPMIRQFTVPDRYNFKNPNEDFEEGQWIPATKGYITKFSAVAYFFAKELYSKYGVPIGLINAALGGSPAEAWISEDAIKKFPTAYSEALRFKDQSLIDEIESRDRKISKEWYQHLNEQDIGLRENWKAENTSLVGWQQMSLPGYWTEKDATPVNGVMWFRKEIIVPVAMLSTPVKIELGRIIDADSVFINGNFCGTTPYQYPPRRYELKSGTLKEGKNTIVVRVVSNSGRGGFVPGKPYELTSEKDTIILLGNWQYKCGATMPPLPGQTFVRWKPIGLFNAMIAPLLHYPIKGVIWYQGEANTSHPEDYRNLMETLITDWRTKWTINFPFLFVQLSNFMEPVAEPNESNWAALRQQQLNTLVVPKTGMAVAIDLGIWNDIHPENKKDVGYRLSLLARELVYREKNLVSQGPVYTNMKIAGNKIILNFRSTGKGLTSLSGNTLEEFSIAGADKKYYRAIATIKNNKVIVFSKEVAKPLSVRYAWANNPDKANLYNKEGLPASPFSTDNK